MEALELISPHLSDDSLKAWALFFDKEVNRGHVRRLLAGSDINEHLLACLQSSRAMVKRVKLDIQETKPLSILEIGCSTGLNCYALQETYPNSIVVGIEPEKEAITVARSMLNIGRGMSPYFVQGVGEKIPLKDNSIDLIICHTVIEHVRDVPLVIKEFSRLLTDRGVVHLDAPNYIWPYEPHLQVWTIPKFGKLFVKWSAIAQGKYSMLSFLDHLQFVTPFELQRLFNMNDLTWENRVERKFIDAIDGKADVKKYRFVAKTFSLFGRLGVAKPIIALAVKMGFYPSVMYTARKAR